jgi:hypothetical protein
MERSDIRGAVVLGLGIFLGLAVLGYFLADAAIGVKEYERTVRAKGLSERELPADIVIWPIRFSVAGDDLLSVYQELERGATAIYTFLEEQGVSREEISTGAPSLIDRSAEAHSGKKPGQLRYTATQTVTVYSKEVDKIRGLTENMLELGKKGVVISGGGYRDSTEYLFTRLNEIKPGMVEEAILNAQETARQFAKNSQSRLGKIKRASQGQFSIVPRDRNTPHIKKIRVVSTVEFYLID